VIIFVCHGPSNVSPGVFNDPARDTGHSGPLHKPPFRAVLLTKDGFSQTGL
jgi:hypothetical protein